MSSLDFEGQQVILVGDRVLVRPDEGESVSRAGLILPASVADAEQVQTGTIVAVGPGIAVPPARFDWDEEEAGSRAEPRWIAMQARVGDFVLFRRKSSVEIRLRHDRYVVVSHDALLVLLRDETTGEPTTTQ